MRISDWSSDVCSSDLFATLTVTGILVQQLQVDAQRTLPARRVEFHAEAFQAQIGQNLGESLCQCLCIHAIYLSGPQKQKMGSNGPFPYLADVPQLGRASCRERVYKYV